jgi:hypothetical protein
MLQIGQDTLESKQRFSGLLKDYFPKEPVVVNLMVLLYEMGIHTEIEKTGRITKEFAYRFTQRLIDKYGTDRQNAENVVRLFCVCYGEKMLGKPCELDVSKEAAANSAQGSEQSAKNDSSPPAQPPQSTDPENCVSSCGVIFWTLTITAILIVLIKIKCGKIEHDPNDKVDAVTSERLIFDKNWTSVPSSFKGDSINDIKELCDVLDIRKDEFESTAAYNERVEKEIAASAVLKRRYVIIEKVRLKYNADKEQFEDSSYYTYSEYLYIAEKFIGNYYIGFINHSKIRTAIIDDGWKIGNKYQSSVRIPSIRMPPEDARKFSDSTGTISLNMLYVFKFAPISSASSDSQNRYIFISYKSGVKVWEIGASLEEIWIYDERDGRIFRKTHIN